MRERAKHDLGVTADCLLALVPGADDADYDDYVRRFVGALVVAEALHELRLIRKALTTEK